MKKIISLLLCFALIFSFAPRINAVSLSTEKTEIVSRRTVYGKTYQLSDGSYQFVSHAEPIHYKNSSGAYVEINNAITDAVRQDGYKYTNTANQWNAHFSEKLDDSNAVMLTSGKYSISFSLMEKAGTVGVVKATTLADSKAALSAYYQKLSADNRAVLYQNVAENVDIAYTVQANTLKEDIILNSKLAPSTYKFRLTANGLTIKEMDGAISLCTADGEEVFSFASLYMEDANGKRSENVFMTYTSVKNGYELTVSADTAFLNAKDTVFPVVIDPSVVVSGADYTMDTFVSEKYPNFNYGTSESLWTGYRDSAYEMYTYLNFYYPLSIKPFQITSVYVYMPKKEYQAPNIKAYAVTGSWSPDSLTWNNQPNHSSTICSSQAVNTTRYNNTNWYRMDITHILKGWLDFSIDEYGLVLIEGSEASANKKTSYYSSRTTAHDNPELEINYNPYYGSRPYQVLSDEHVANVNCMGYALEYYDFLIPEDIGVINNDLVGLSTYAVKCEFMEILSDWMDDNIGVSNWAYIESEDSNIFENWYRVYCYITFESTDGNGVFDTGERLTFHWMYQTNTGLWATKNGEGAPYQKTLDAYELQYPNRVIFIQVRDVRTINW